MSNLISYNINLLQLNYREMVSYFESHFGKGEYHAKAYFKYLYQDFLTPLPHLKSFSNAASLCLQLAASPVVLPTPSLIERDESNIKFSLDFGGGVFSESVIIGMKNYKTLCISSQTGCRWGCHFCQTGLLGFRHHLTTAQIMAQYMVASFYFEEKIDNIVFMGMGEALDNSDQVFKAIDNLTHPYGPHIATRHITISTVGLVENIEKLGALIKMDQERAQNPQEGVIAPTAYRNLRLAVSLNASNNQIRSQLMPVNLRHNMAELKNVLKAVTLKRKDHDLFIEYILIPGLTDGLACALELVNYLKDLPSVVNLIPYNAGADAQFSEPSEESINNFFSFLVSHGQVVRRRHKRGATIGAACGQLGVADDPQN